MSLRLSVENIVQVVLLEQLHVLLACDSEAVEQVIGVGLAELGRVVELGAVVFDIVVLLNGLHDVALAFELEELLGDHHVRVVHIDQEVAQVTCGFVGVGRVTEGTLVVGNGPGWSGHDAQVAVSGGVDSSAERHLRERHLLGCHRKRRKSVVSGHSTE